MYKGFIVKRFIAYMIDAYAIGLIIMLPAFFIISTTAPDNLFLLFMSTVELLFNIIYFYLFEKYYHTTIGKKIMKLKVVGNVDSNYFVRSIFKFVPLNVISFLLTEDGRFWHDKYSNTNVVKTF